MNPSSRCPNTELSWLPETMNMLQNEDGVSPNKAPLLRKRCSEVFDSASDLLALERVHKPIAVESLDTSFSEGLMMFSASVLDLDSNPPAAADDDDSSDVEAKTKIQLQIEAQAERVRRSFTPKKGPSAASRAAAANMASKNKRRRKTIHSMFPSSAEALFAPLGPLHREEGEDSGAAPTARTGRLIFQSGLRTYFRNCFSENELESEVASEACADAVWSSEPSSAARRVNSTNDLVSPSIETLISSMQKSDSITLNPPPHTIAVTKNDVICGRGTITNSLIGNRRYKILIDLHQQAYSKGLSDEERTGVARSVVRTVRQSVPGGRFLKLDLATGLWGEVGDEAAVEHAERSLREGCGVPPPTPSLPVPSHDADAMELRGAPKQGSLGRALAA